MSQPNATLTPAPESPARSKMDTKTVVSLAMLTGIAFVVMLASKLMPGVMFLDFDFKDVVICIGGFTYGPVAAALTGAFCCTASAIYQKLHTKKGAVIGLFSGMAALVVIMLLWNWLITPIYMGLPRAEVVAMLPTLFLPFNLAKGGMNMAATLLLYKPVVTALRKSGLVSASANAQQSEGKTLNAGFLLFSLFLLATFVVMALVLAGVI